MRKTTNLLKLLLFCIMLGLISGNSFAQLTGVKTIPGDYANFNAAITALNSQGVGSGGVTFNVAAGFIDTAVNLIITATGTSSNQIVFQKSGSGANPLIIAGVGTSTTLDGIITLSGSDYVTFNGIDLQENDDNTTTTTQMEWGYGLLKVDGTDGSQSNTIKNCVITLNRTNTNSTGIYLANHTASSTSSLTVTAFSGTNTNNMINGNTIQNCYTGIYAGGYADASPYDFYDHYNQIGYETGNTIGNFGGSSSTAYGIYAIYQDSLAVNNNNISGGTGTTSTQYGIMISICYNSSILVYNNTVSDTTSSTSSSTYGIALSNAGYNAVDNTVIVKRNTVTGMTSTATTSGALYGYYIYYTTSINLYIDSNKFVDNKWGGPTQTATGTIYGFYIRPYTTSPTAGSIEYITNNYLSGNTRTQSALGSGTFYGMYNYYGNETVHTYNNIFENDTMATTTSTTYYMYVYNYYSSTVTYHDNIVRNIYRPTGTGTTYGIYISNAAYTGTFDYYNNTVHNIKSDESASIYAQYNASTAATKNVYNNTSYSIQTSLSGSVYGIYCSGGTSVDFYKNSVYDLKASTGSAYGVYIGSGTDVNVYNNMISDIESDASTSILANAGLYISGGTNVNAYYNTIYLDAASTSSTTFGTAGLYASTSPTVDLRNNIVVNVSAPGPTGGNTVAYYRSSSTLSTYSNVSDNNCFYAGTPDVNKLIYYDGSTSLQTLGEYKQLVSPRDANSFTETPPFVNVTTPPYNLHIATGSPTGVESGGTPITSPIVITTDFDDQTRNATTPDVGADEGNFTLGDLQKPLIVYTPLGNTGLITNRNLVATITDNLALNTTPPNDPRIYYKKGANSTFKYRNKTSQAGDDFTFTIVVDSMGTLTAGDTVFYYVAAQDVGTPPVSPNCGTNPAGGSGVNPPGTTPPPEPNYYIITNPPLTGVYTIPGAQYSTIAAALGDVTLRGVGTGGVTFNVLAGYTETAANLVLEVDNNSSSPIVFQKSGSGANPLITAGTGVGTMDGIIIISGTDYVTFDGIDVKENPANLSPTAQMEWGYALLKVDGTNGAQNITIKNCDISLDKSYTSTYGIYSANHTTSSTAALTVTAISGENSNNKFYSNTIHNCYSGIYIGGFVDASPYTFYDNGNDIGSLGGNTIRDFGGSTSSTFGIYTTYQDSLSVSNNDIGGGTGSTSTSYGIYVYYGYNANVTVYNNTVSDTTATLSSSTYGIAVYYAGNSGVDNTVTIKRNTVQGMTNTAAGTSCSLYGYYHYYLTANTLIIDSNKFVNNKWGNETGTFTGTIYSFYNYIYTTTPSAGSVEYISNNYVSGNRKIQSATGSGSHYGMYNYYGLDTVYSYNNMVEFDTLATTSTNYGIYMYHYYSSTAYIHDNTVRNIYKTDGSTGSYYGIYLSNAAYQGTCNYYNNSVHDIGVGASTAAIYGQYLAATSVNKNIYGNSVYNMQASLTGNVYGMYQSGGTNVEFYKNRIYGLTTESGYGYGLYISSGTTNNIYNNYISDIKSESSTNDPALYGMYISGGTSDNIYYNTIYLNSTSSGTTFGTATLYASTSPTLDLRNNIIVNMSTPGSSSGNVVAFRRSSTTLTSYSDSSNNNCFYAGTPGTNHLIFYDGTNSDQTIEAFKTRVSPRDANSFSENPPFVNVTTPPYNLHLQTTVPTMCESGALPITIPPITDDYDGDTRNAVTPDVGADEGNFMSPLPPAPALIAPPNGATNQSVTPLMDWSDVSGAISYRIVIATDTSFSSPAFDTSGITASQITVPAGKLSGSTLYYWKVNATNGAGTGPWSPTWNFTTMAQFPNLTITVYLEGFYTPEPVDNKSKGLQLKNLKGGISNGLKNEVLAQVADTIRIYVADSLQNYAFVDSAIVYLPSSGTATTQFTGISTGKYYIVVRHRNHLETWSKYAVSFTGGGTTTYDFTIAASQAYGDNMKQVGSVWVLYGGDPNQDGEIGALDIPIFISQFGTQGYLSCDFNGDGDVTGVDQQILIQNYGLTIARPMTIVLNPANRIGLKEFQKILKEIKKNNQ